MPVHKLVNWLISNYRRPAWMGTAFLAVFHTVFVTYVYILFLFVQCTCTVENKILFFFSSKFYSG